LIIIFDLDGTILDTYQLIRQNFVEVFDKFLPNHQYTEEELESYFGPSLIESFMKVVNDKQVAEKLISEYRKFSALNHSKYLRLFPNVVEVLQKIKEKNYKIAILSNKLHNTIIQGLELTGIKDYFDFIVGLDDINNPKPHPEGIEKIISHFNDDRCIFIGDTVIDIETARRANVKSVGCTWALTKRETFITVQSDYIADEFLDIIKILEEHYV